MAPTSRAEQLAGPIRSALAQLRQTFEAPDVFNPLLNAHRFRIALSDDVELRLVSLLARAILPGELRIQTRRLDWLFTVPEAELRNGTLDLAIGYFPDARYLSSSLVMQPLSEENNLVIARRSHRLWRGRLTIERFTELDHAAVIYRSQLWGLIDTELASRGLQRRLKLALPHCLSVLHAVASSDLIACIQESVVERFDKGLNLIAGPNPSACLRSSCGWSGIAIGRTIQRTSGPRTDREWFTGRAVSVPLWHESEPLQTNSKVVTSGPCVHSVANASCPVG